MKIFTSMNNAQYSMQTSRDTSARTLYIVDMFCLVVPVIPERQAPIHEADTTHPVQEQSTVPDQTTLLPNEAEAFALEPLDVTSIGKQFFRAVLPHRIMVILLLYTYLLPLLKLCEYPSNCPI